MRMVLVFPAPFGPKKPKVSPGWTLKSIPSTATSSPKRFWRLRATTGGAALTTFHASEMPIARFDLTTGRACDRFPLAKSRGSSDQRDLAFLVGEFEALPDSGARSTSSSSPPRTALATPKPGWLHPATGSASSLEGRHAAPEVASTPSGFAGAIRRSSSSSFREGAAASTQRLAHPEACGSTTV